MASYSKGQGGSDNQNQGLFFVHKALAPISNKKDGYEFQNNPYEHLPPQISIIGIKNIIEKDVPWKRKLLWIISLLICCALVTYYVSSRVAYILSKPTQVAVTLRQNDSLQLPDVTLCPNIPFLPIKLVQFGMTADGLPGPTFKQQQNNTSSTFNSTQLWIDLAPTMKFISHSSVNSINTMKSWNLVFTAMGVCFQHRYDDSVKASGLSFGMSLSINWRELAVSSKALSDLEGLKIFFHERTDSPLTEVDGINVTPGEDLSVAIRLKEFKSLHRVEHPCVETTDYSRSQCVNQCFNRELLQLTRCSLPFMTPPTSPSTTLEQQKQQDMQELVVIRPCSSVEFYTSAFRTFWKKSKRNLTLWAECGRSCMIECQKLIYTPYVESVSISRSDNDNVGKFTIYFPEMWYEIVEQKESYDVIAFLCDVGGTFGLFLGCSLLTLVELLEIIVTFLGRRVCYPRSTTTPPDDLQQQY